MLRVTFDSNVWEHIVDWVRYGSDQPARKTIHDAIRDGVISAYISERILTVESIRRSTRAAKLAELADNYVSVKTEVVEGGATLIVSFNGVSDLHPGAHPVLSDRLMRATALGFKVLPDSFFGTVLPSEPDLSPFYAGPEEWGDRTRDEILNEDSRISSEIASRGVGRGRLEAIGKRIQSRLGWSDCGWFDGLDRPKDESEAKEIADAFGEMVDGDVVAAHIAYRFNILCTQDLGGKRASIFDTANRRWLTDRYGVSIMGVRELAATIAASKA